MSQKLLSCFGLLGSVERTPAASLFKTRSVELATDDSIAQTDVLHAAAAHQDDRVLLKVVPLAGNICGDFHAVGESNASNLTDG